MDKWKRCNRCGFTSVDLQWDKELYAKQGYWKLAIITNNNGIITKIPHECNVEQKQSTPTGPTLECKLCFCTMYGFFSKQEDLDEHIKLDHPNGEIRYDDYYSIIKPKDDDYVNRPCKPCTEQYNIPTVHPHKYVDVKDKTSFDCIR